MLNLIRLLEYKTICRFWYITLFQYYQVSDEVKDSSVESKAQEKSINEVPDSTQKSGKKVVFILNVIVLLIASNYRN